MTNQNLPMFLEYGILALALIGLIIMMILGRVSFDAGIIPVTGIITYAVGSAKGAATIGAIQSVTGQTGGPTNANTTDTTKAQ